MNTKILIAVVSSWAITGTIAMADTTFGSLPAATFGGTGNPNDAVEITTINHGQDVVTLGLAAQQRYSNPPLGNDGAGTYFATPGANLQGSPATLGALWNFDFYAIIAGAGNASQYTFKLYYDFDPAVGTPKAQLGVINLNNANIAAGGSATTQTIQDSENLDFGFLASSLAGVITPPSGSFDPNATGEYSFILEADQDGREIGEADINVDVGTVPEITTTAPLLGLALGGLAFFAARKNRGQVTA